jgi:hypothetical protein
VKVEVEPPSLWAGTETLRIKYHARVLNPKCLFVFLGFAQAGTFWAKGSSPHSPYLEYGSLTGFTFHPKLHQPVQTLEILADLV